jgi:uncharacterized protein YutE (UPF0331/DUF86 family)
MMPMRPSNDVVGRRLAHQRDLLTESGVITTDLAHRLKPSVGLRNVLVHLYTDIDVEIVADSVAEIIEHFGGYVRAVARWMVAESS